MRAQRFTLTDVRRSYTPEKRWAEMEGELPSFLLYRPISIWLTPPFLWLGISPGAVTSLGLLISLAMPFVAWRGGPYAYVAVAAMALGNHVLDCIDGNIARTTGRVSGAGALFDGFCDLAFWALYFASIGILVERASDGPITGHGTEIALGLAVLVLLHRQLRDSFALEYAERAEFAPHPPPSLSPWSVVRMCLIGLEHVYAFGILVAGALGILEWLLVAIAAYVVLIFAAAVGLTFAQAIRKDASCKP